MSNNTTSLLPDGSYKRIADITGKSEGLVAQYFGATKARMSLQTELDILEAAENIAKEVLDYLRQKKQTAKKNMRKKQKIAA